MHTITTEIARHMRQVHFGGNWTVSNMKGVLAGITLQQATHKIEGLNTIAVLVFHMNYFVDVALKVLRGGPLEGKDELSFDHPPLESEADWEAMVKKALDQAEQMADLIEKLPDETLLTVFTNEKYGTWYRNLQGIIEHTHYHLGQVALIKKLVQTGVY